MCDEFAVAIASGGCLGRTRPQTPPFARTRVVARLFETISFHATTSQRDEEKEKRKKKKKKKKKKKDGGERRKNDEEEEERR